MFAFFHPLAIGVFDQFVNARMLDRYPQLYRLGQRSTFYNTTNFWYWIANSFFHSIVMYYGLTAVYGESIMRADGLNSNNWVMGEMIYTADGQKLKVVFIEKLKPKQKNVKTVTIPDDL